MENDVPETREQLDADLDNGIDGSQIRARIGRRLASAGKAMTTVEPVSLGSSSGAFTVP